MIQHDFHNATHKPITYVGEKTPANMFHIGLLYRWFPQSHILFIYRRPIDVLISEVNKGSKPDYPLNKANPLYPYGLAVFVFGVWPIGALMVLLFHRRRRDQFTIVSYVALARDTSSVVAPLTERLAIPFSPHLCHVAKVDSRLADKPVDTTWQPPRCLARIYSALLSPLQTALERRAVGRALDPQFCVRPGAPQA